MEGTKEGSVEDILKKDTPQLVALLREMKEGLDTVRSKIQLLTAKVKENNFPTADGFSYLEAKHLLLISYCQSIVYYLLRKVKGLPIDGHPVVRSLIEIRLFLEKVRPIDKKLDYQIQKLLKIASNTGVNASGDENKLKEGSNTDDLLKYRPNPDMLVPKLTNTQDGDAVYKPPFLSPVEMDDDKISKAEKQILRREKQNARQMNQSSYVKEFIDRLEGRPEEVREIAGADSRELTKFMEKIEARSRAEEEHFTRAPLTKAEKSKGKHLKRSRNGLMALTDGFEEEIRTLGVEEYDSRPEVSSSRSRGKRFNKNKRRR